jgi:hypothetical protein
MLGTHAIHSNIPFERRRVMAQTLAKVLQNRNPEAAARMPAAHATRSVSMNSHDLHPGAIPLRKGEIHRLHDGLGRRVEALSGSLWITIDHDRRDVIVNAGEGFNVDASGDALISAMADSRFVLLDPVALQRG